MTKKEERARRLILRAEKLKDEAKGKWDKADELTSRACQLMGNGSRVRLSDTQVAVITDQFEESVKTGKEVVWAHGAARRWKVDIKAA